MKINLSSFLNPNVYRGGGEVVTKALMDRGLERGHDIAISSLRPKSSNSLHKNPDLNILVDIFNNAHTVLSLGAWRSFNDAYLNKILTQAPFIHFTNAYADICNLGYLPCGGNSSNPCLFKKELSLKQKLVINDFGDNCFSIKSKVRSLYEKSLLNVYVSPLHKEISEKVLGLNNIPDSFILKPLIDTNRFFNANIERDIDFLFVGIIGEAKGYFEMRDKFKDKNIHLIGKIAPGIHLDFGTHYGHVPYDKVPEYMNRAKNFVFLPRWPEPQGRVVVEAALSGCNIIGNENVGALSFPMDLSDPKNYVDVENEFWEKVESLNI